MIDALVPSKTLDTDGQLLDALHEGSEVLQNITDMFRAVDEEFSDLLFLGTGEDGLWDDLGLCTSRVVPSSPSTGIDFDLM